MLFNDNLNINSAEYVQMKKALNSLLSSKESFDIWGYSAYCIIELKILIDLSLWMLNTWAYLPCNM